MTESTQPYSFSQNHPHLIYTHKLDVAAVTAASTPPHSPDSSETIKDMVDTTPAIIFSDGRADDEQAILMWLAPRSSQARLPYTIVAGQQTDGWDTFDQTVSFVNRLEIRRGNTSGTLINEHTFRGDGFLVIRGGPMLDPEETGEGLSNAEREAMPSENRRVSHEAAIRVSACIQAPYVAHVWTSLNTFSRLSKKAKDLCRLVVFTCSITPTPGRFSAGWNLAADVRSWTGTQGYCATRKTKVICVRGQLLGVRADHQMAFDKCTGGYEGLLDPAVRLHPDDKASFRRVKDKVMGESLEQMCGALSFLRGSKTMIRPVLKGGSTLGRLVNDELWTACYALRPSSVFLASHIVSNNPYLDTMGDPFGLVLTHPEVHFIPVSIDTDDPFNIDVSPVEAGNKAFTYLAVAPSSFDDTFTEVYPPPVHVYGDIAGPTGARLPLVDQAAASEWPEYCEVMSGLVRECQQQLEGFSGEGLTEEHRSQAIAEYDRILSELEDGTMTRVSKAIIGSG